MQTVAKTTPISAAKMRCTPASKMISPVVSKKLQPEMLLGNRTVSANSKAMDPTVISRSHNDIRTAGKPLFVAVIQFSPVDLT